jgi:DNA-binding ferritin-like protein
MVNQHIITFQSSLKDLAEDAGSLSSIIDKVLELASRLQDTCTTIEQTLQNIERDAEKI